MLKAARGYRGGRSKLFRPAKETLRRAWWYGRAHRRKKTGDFRSLWITRINAAARLNGSSYSQLMAGLSRAGVDIDRKILADLAVHDGAAFGRLVDVAKGAVAA